MKKLKPFIIKLLKWAGKILVSLVLLVTILALMLKLPFVQRMVTQRAISYYADRVNTPANLSGLYLDFPTTLVMEGLYLEDQQADTLVYFDELNVSTNVLGLLRNELRISEVSLYDATANLLVNEDGIFNFQYIIDAFAPEEPSESTGSGSFGLYVGGVSLSNVKFSYLDLASGLDLEADVQEIKATTREFDLANSLIDIDYAGIQGGDASLRLFEGANSNNEPDTDVPDSVEDETEGSFQVKGRFAEILDTHFRLEDDVSKLVLDTRVTSLQVEIDTLDIASQIYLAESINMVDPSVSIMMHSSSDSLITVDSEEPVEFDSSTYEILAGSSSVQLSGGEFRLWDHSKELTDGLDPMHMWFKDMNLQAGKLRYRNGEAWGDIRKLSANDSRNGAQLKKLGGQVAFTEEYSSLEEFTFEFNQSAGSADIRITYPSLDELYGFTSEVDAQADLDVKIQPSDLSYFFPLPEQIPQRLLSSPAMIAGGFEGSINDFVISTTNLSWGNTEAQIGSASVQDPLAFPKSVIVADAVSVKTVNEAVGMFLGDSITAMLPDVMSLNTTMTYAPDSIYGNASLTTSDGNIQLQGRARRAWDSAFNYVASAQARSFNLNKIVPEAGLLSFSTKVAGKGLTSEDFISAISLKVDTLQYLDYTYSNLSMEGTITEDTFEGEASYSDENLDFDFEGYAGLPGHEKNQRFSLHLERADLEALGFVEDEFRVVGDLVVDLVLSLDKDLTGTATITNLGVNREGSRYDFEKITLDAVKVDSVRNLKLESGFMNAELQTTFPIPQLVDISTSFINSYLEDGVITPRSPHYFSFNMELLKPEFLTDVLLQDLSYIDISPIAGEFDGSKASLTTQFEVDSLAYGSWALDSLKVNLMALEEDLSGGIKLRTVQNGAVKVENASVDFVSREDGVDLILAVKDEFDAKRYEVASVLTFADSIYKLSLDPERVMLNYEAWEVPSTNAVEIHPGFVWFEDFQLSQDGQRLSLNSEIHEGGDSLLVVKSQDFELSEVVSLTEDSIPPISGVLNGRVDIKTEKDSYGSNADLNITGFTLRGFEVGNVKLTSQQASGDRFDATLDIEGAGNDLRLVGSYQNDGELTADLEVLSLQLDPLEGLSNGTLSQIDGNVTGNFAVRGTVAAPELNGNLNFDDVQLEIEKLKSRFTISDQNLRVEQNRFIFSDFTLADESSRQARINGSVDTEDFQDYALDMRIVTDSFTLIDSKKEDNPLLYGTVRATSTLDIKGTSDLPKINLDLTLSDNSSATYVIPESTIAAQVQSDVIRFVDRDSEKSDFLNGGASSDTIRSELRGLDLKAVINVPSTNTLKIVVDPITGDALTVKGEALLNLTIRPNGDITLTGRYEVKQGAYNMDFYGLVKREFKIREGSFILWTGDIYKAILNVTAVYETRAKPVQSDYDDRLDFQVELLLNGEILKPEIKFRLGLAEGSPAPISVQSWIAQMNQDEAQVNKQAFGLLIFNSFFDDTANNWYDNLASNTARSSVSSLLSGELNKLSDKIDGVELTFDIDSYEDYNKYGENVGRTQLELGISKNLFNDRVIVKFAGNFDLEGASAYKNNVSDFSGDIRIEYLLTEDGRYRLVGFRESNYDDLLQGEIIKTGAGFIFVRDYDALRELFEKKKERTE